MFQLVYSVVGVGELRSGDLDGYEMKSFLYSPADAFQMQDVELGQPFLRCVVEGI